MPASVVDRKGRQSVIWESEAAEGYAGPSAVRPSADSGNGAPRNGAAVLADDEALEEALGRIDRPLLVEAGPAGRWHVQVADRPGPLRGGAFVPAVRLESLGDAGFRADHQLRYAYLAGA